MLDDGPPDRDALPLAAGHLTRLLVELLFDFEDSGGLRDARLDLCFRHAGVAQAERHVLAHGHVRVERIMLENHRHAALAWRELIDPLPFEADLAAVERLEAGDDAKKRRFPASGRAEESDELASLHIERDVVEHQRLAERLADVAQFEAGQVTPFYMIIRRRMISPSHAAVNCSYQLAGCSSASQDSHAQ